MKFINNSLLALACGDSYGSCYERDGLVGVKFDVNILPDKPKIPIVTDDTKMATILLKHYKKYNGIDVEKLFLEYKYWARTEGYKDGIGIHTRAVLLEGKADKDSQGNGALMRVIPFGAELISDGYSFKEAVCLMNIDSAITHKNTSVFMANKLCLDITINGIEAVNKKEYQGLLSNLYSGDTAWVLHTLYIVIETLQKELNFLDGFKYIVSQGGDTDTNCAIYGAIKGGLDNISTELDILDFISKRDILLINK